MKFRLIPREEKFFDLFEKQALCAGEAARLMREILEHPELAAATYSKLERLENDADEYLKEIRKKLDTTFVVPIDREDIATLSQKLDDITDDIDSVGRRMMLFAKHLGGSLATVSGLLPKTHELVQVLVWATERLPKVVDCVRHPKREQISGEHAAVHRLENEGDEIWEGEGGILDSFIGHLANNPAQTATKEDLLLLFWKEVCHSLERAIDLVKNVVDISSSIIDKNA